MKKQLQKGFTLIELMIVVAIIGILAAIALPAYQDYIARGQAAESVVLLEGAKINIETEVATNGAFPANLAALAPLGINTTGKYGTITAATPNAIADGGTVDYTFTAGAVNANLTGAGADTVTYTRTPGTGVWSCSSTIPAKYAPKGC